MTMVILTTLIELWLVIVGYSFILLLMAVSVPAIAAAVWFLLFRWKPWTL
jgi:hypothetical protein